MLRLNYLKTESHLLGLILSLNEAALFYSKGMQDIPVVFKLGVLAKLVTQDDSTLGFVDNTPL